MTTRTYSTPTNRRVLSWADDLEDNTLAQALRTARLPFVEQPVALMADAHLGMGATVGSVVATHGAIIPSAVGVDIGCGMAAIRLDLNAEQLPDDLGRVHSAIASRVPAGVPTKANKDQGSHNDDRVGPLHPIAPLLDRAPELVQGREQRRAVRQFGTLGSGNHFVELCLDELDRVWLVLHSGSRGIGHSLASAHIERAKGIMRRYFIELEDPDLAYLAEGTTEFSEYVEAMLWAQDYARENRRMMLFLARGAIEDSLGRPVEVFDVVNCHHNYAEREHHNGRNVWVTRKGAIRAREGELGIIPGSMATGSFIVEGLGNAASYQSASHGAGRRLSRRAARQQLTAESLDEVMAGIAWNGDPEGLLDEHPQAYKDIGTVMAAQADLVQIRHRLRTILNFKGL